MTDHRLASLCLLPPPASTPWMGHECELAPTSFSRVDGVGVSIDLPLFWYNPPWTWMSYRQADWVATAVAERRVIVSALWRDLSDDEMPLLHSPPETEDAATEDAATEGSAADHQDEERVFDRSPRMVPYRPERYGLLPDDFDHAKVIDVRLTVHRDSSGRFAYSPDQIQRWEATPEDSPHAGGGFVPAGTFPPDVTSLKHLGRKLEQLRHLSPSAAVFASLPPYRLEEELSGVLAAKPDGVILRLDEMDLEPLQLAALTRLARKLMKSGDAEDRPLWVVPGRVTPDDAAKLIALGASAVAIDHWCEPLVEDVLESGGGSPYSSFGYADVAQYASARLEEKIDRFKGVVASLGRLPRGERLGSFSAAWTKALRVKSLG